MMVHDTDVVYSAFAASGWLDRASRAASRGAKKRKDRIAGKVDTNMDAVKRRREAEKMKPGPLDVRQFSLQYFYFRETLNLIVFLCF